MFLALRIGVIMEVERRFLLSRKNIPFKLDLELGTRYIKPTSVSTNQAQN